MEAVDRYCIGCQVLGQIGGSVTVSLSGVFAGILWASQMTFCGLGERRPGESS
ncbi:MAG: hypothetical protein ABI972_15855 [Acidobacteriota bacterium]